MKIEFYHIDAFEVPHYEPIWRALKQMGVDAKLVAVPGHDNAAAPGWFDFDRFVGYCDAHQLPYTTEMDPHADVGVTTQRAAMVDVYRCKARIMYGPHMYPGAWGMQPHSLVGFDAVLTHGSYYTAYYSTWFPTQQLPIVGYPRYDRFFLGALERATIHKRWGIDPDNTKPVLVFLPTWAENTAFDLFLPALLRLSHQYQIILRPHHCTIRFESNRMQALKDSGLLIIEDAFALDEMYVGADLVLADVRSGAAYEACMCQVPTIGMVLDPNEIQTWLLPNRIDKIMHLCADPTLLEPMIQLALTTPLPMKAREQWLESRVAFREGGAGRAAAEALIQLAESRKKTRSLKKTILAHHGIDDTLNQLIRRLHDEHGHREIWQLFEHNTSGMQISLYKPLSIHVYNQLSSVSDPEKKVLLFVVYAMTCACIGQRDIGLSLLAELVRYAPNAAVITEAQHHLIGSDVRFALI
jgi:hypothetical protein